MERFVIGKLQIILMGLKPKQQVTPTISNVYQAFEKYVEVDVQCS